MRAKPPPSVRVPYRGVDSDHPHASPVAPGSDPTIACSDSIESLLRKHGLTLTMGGEPTFVPRYPEGAEWAGAALGPTKLGYARRLAAALLHGALRGGVVIETSGKLYPGEDLPRWSLQLHWRKDGVPLWSDGRKLRDDDPDDGGCSIKMAGALMRAIASALELDSDCILAAEDACGAADDDSTAPEPCGWVLPLDYAEGKWISDRWPVPEGRLRLVEDGRWIGLRLPLTSLPEGALHRALSVEVRAGQLAVFIPPLLFASYAGLLAVIEAQARRLELPPVVLAGYAPPPEEDVFAGLCLTPDPGVIEVNLPPCRDWPEYRDWLVRIYAAAASVGLCAQKLHYNGRATGTGGGAHLCFGGPSPAASPFFSRPDLVTSILRYWQRHPVLSFAFTGQYLGPTSQAPRPDETLPDRLDELELACDGVTRVCRADTLIHFDRLFRHLLSDGGGNTHRTEISVDKLWNPLMPNGCLGLVEWRAFETLPDARDLAHVGLFIRATLARLLDRPYPQRFHDWGPLLRDRFYLPSFLWLDLREIVADLRASQIGFDEQWLVPAWEFRFPLLGTLETPQGAIEVRQALEAWPVMSEQENGAITSRVVDSSLDRLEFRLKNPAAATRGHLLVNGEVVELRREGDVCAAGVRFRAFALTNAYHPHVPRHTPLRIEWIDAATRTVAAAARWHSWNPTDQPYPDPPHDETDARNRVIERWQLDPSSIGEIRRLGPRSAGQNAHSYTLDLRRCEMRVEP